MEKINEKYGIEGSVYDFGARLYDSRLGRWMAVDPLMPKYPDLSPYVFVANSPIICMDKDGRDIVFHYTPPSNGNPGNLTITVNYKIIDLRTNGYESDITALKSQALVNQQLNGTYNTGGGYNVKVNVNLNLQVVSSTDQIVQNEHVIALVDEINGLEQNGKVVIESRGAAELNGNVAMIKAVFRGTTVLHEILHNLGLGHVNIPENLMYGSSPDRLTSSLTIDQKRELFNWMLPSGKGDKSISGHYRNSALKALNTGNTKEDLKLKLLTWKVKYGQKHKVK